MSGGGGTGDWVFDAPSTDVSVGPGGSAGAGSLACERLRFPARLRSVDPGELAQVDVGDVLLIVPREEPRLVVGAYRQASGAPAGSPVGVLLDRLSELVPCLTLLDFEAEVTAINGGSVRVVVRPAPAR